MVQNLPREAATGLLHLVTIPALRCHGPVHWVCHYHGRHQQLGARVKVCELGERLQSARKKTEKASPEKSKDAPPPLRGPSA
jgi:hypothetical protein